MQDHLPLEANPGRKAPAKGVKILPGRPTIVYVTVCAKDRVPWMAQPLVQSALAEIWRQADAWLVGYYLLMPDHLRLFCAPRDLHFTIEAWLASWKSMFTRQHITGSGKWQRDAFHHRLRDPGQYHEKWQYIRENPLREGLVARVEDWPYWGMIHELRW